MREMGIRGAGSRRKRPPTTLPGDPAECPSDLLDRHFHAAAPNRRWEAGALLAGASDRPCAWGFRCPF